MFRIPKPVLRYTWPPMATPSLFLKVQLFNVALPFNKFKVPAIPALFSNRVSSNITGNSNVLLHISSSLLFPFLLCGHWGGSTFVNSIWTIARSSSRFTNWVLLRNLQFFTEISPLTFLSTLTERAQSCNPRKVTFSRSSFASKSGDKYTSSFLGLKTARL